MLSKIRAFRSDLGNINKKTKTIVYIMQFYNARFLGSLAAFVLIGVNAGQAQSSDSMSANVGGSIPTNVSGGFAKFSPNSKVNSLARAANGALTHTTSTFPMPSIAGHPGVAVLALSPGFFDQEGNLFLPLDPQSHPAKTGDFALLGGVSVSYPNVGIFITFTEFREDISGNLFARVTANGQAIGGGEIELVTASAARIGLTADKTQFTIQAKLRVAAQLAQAVNALFNSSVLVPDEQIATEDLVADVIN